MIKIDSVSKWYGPKQAVNKVSFQVSKGEVLAFIGPNGAGKSTTMRMITGFIPASEGTISIDGNDIETGAIKAKSKMGYLPENAPLYPHKTVEEFLNFVAEIRGFSGNDKKEKVQTAIDKCFLEPVRHQSIETLSKGYKHRTCFAQAILHDPEVLILDEPTDGLDPNQKREVRNLIKDMGETKAIIISTHILEEVEAVASRVILINEGKKVFDGAPSKFRQQARTAGSVLLTVHNITKNELIEKIQSANFATELDIASQDSESITIQIFSDNDTEKLKQDVANFVKKEDINFSEFKVDKGRLEDVFYSYTEGNKEEVE